MTTTAAPCLRRRVACSRKRASPTLREMLFTIGFPWHHFSPATTISNFDASSMNGAFATGGQGALWREGRWPDALAPKDYTVLADLLCEPGGLVGIRNVTKNRGPFLEKIWYDGYLGLFEERAFSEKVERGKNNFLGGYLFENMWDLSGLDIVVRKL